MLTSITIKDEYITLGQLLKLTNIVSSGGQIKEFLTNAKVLVNNVIENRRGRKLRVDDLICIDGKKIIIQKNNL